MNGENIEEQISVLASFGKRGVKPVFFRRLKDREFKRVNKVNFSYLKKIGRKKIVTFEVETDTASYEISYDMEDLVWQLNQVFLPGA